MKYLTIVSVIFLVVMGTVAKADVPKQAFYVNGMNTDRQNAEEQRNMLESLIRSYSPETRNYNLELIYSPNFGSGNYKIDTIVDGVPLLPIFNSFAEGLNKCLEYYLIPYQDDIYQNCQELRNLHIRIRSWELFNGRTQVIGYSRGNIFLSELIKKRKKDVITAGTAKDLSFISIGSPQDCGVSDCGSLYRPLVMIEDLVVTKFPFNVSATHYSLISSLILRHYPQYKKYIGEKRFNRAFFNGNENGHSLMDAYLGGWGMPNLIQKTIAEEWLELGKK